AGCASPAAPLVTTAPVNVAAVAPAAAGAPPKAADAPSVSPPPAAKPNAIASPLSDAPGRITKKPFGMYVSPGSSPVSPERFRGYHTGVDFETTSAEQDMDVPVNAICDGTLVMKKRAAGYGGVAVESCVIGGRTATVVYGHVRLTSVKTAVGGALSAGHPFAVLGKGFSDETDGERKHLHLGIHEGTAVVILGYVPKKADLGAWMDAATLLP
ncbi:MAG: hypothetical protein RL272_204, partial [Candidatus Parcubacteria bacterium]